MITLYHGSSERIDAITDQGVFGGLCASRSKESALSHGDVLHLIKIDDDALLTQSHLNYQADYTTVKAIIVLNTAPIEDGEFDAVWELIVGDAAEHDSELDEDRLLAIFRSFDLASVGFEIQRLRGLIAEALGFKAVEIRDEHGASILVLPGVRITSA